MLKYLILTLLFYLTWPGYYLLPQSQPESARPNVLFISIDDLNDWVGFMDGHPNAKTPNMDLLAAQGTIFANTHCQAPLCGPSRASLMSGLRPSTSGVYGQINDRDLYKVPAFRDIIYLPQYFGQQGYKTMGKGKLFHNFAPDGVFEVAGGREGGFGPKPQKRFKYDPEWFGKPGGTQTDWGVYPASDEEMIDYKTAKWGRTQLQQKHDRPFFLALGFVRPHVPWYAPQKWFDRHPVEAIQTPPYLPEDQQDVPEISRKVHEVPMMPTTEWATKNGQWKDICQAYLASTSFVDHYVGEVLNVLEQSQYADNTIIILWSDHGYHIGEKNRFAKHSNWERSSKVPLIIAGNGLPKGQVTHQPVELLDMYPTLLDLCGLAPNPANEGKSLKPLIENPGAAWGYPAITTYGRNNHAIRTGQYRYIHYEDDAEELYNHQVDPNEWKNIAGQEAHQSLKDSLKQFLPTTNARWAEPSNLPVNPYFRNQKSTQQQSSEKRPNIVFFFSDDHGVEDASCYGHPQLKTPILDHFAKEGMKFTRAFSPASVCTPSRALTYTGLYPFDNGCDRNHEASHSDVLSIPDYLQPLGYEVVIAGKVNVKPKAAFPFKTMARTEVADYLANVGDQPFCLIICYNMPHGPFFNKKGGINPNNVKSKEWLPDTEATRKFIAAQYDNIENLDNEIGTHLFWLHKYGFEDAVQIYSSDHGGGYPFGKWTLYEKGLHIPFIVKWKGVVAANTTNDAMISLIDVLPSFIEMAGGTAPPQLDGKSIVSLLKGERHTHHNYIFATYTNLGVNGANEYPIRSIRNDRYKLIVNLRHENKFEIKAYMEDDKRAVVDMQDVYISWLEAGQKDAAIAKRAQHYVIRPRFELYDLKNDPNELDNLAGLGNHQEIKEMLYDRLRNWMGEQEDPLLEEM